jgi:hypothetical protein
LTEAITNGPWIGLRHPEGRFVYQAPENNGFAGHEYRGLQNHAVVFGHQYGSKAVRSRALSLI